MTRSTASALCLAALVLQAGLVTYALWTVSLTRLSPGQLAATVLMLGTSSGTIGISAAHELVHRHSAFARGTAQAYMLLVSYPHFPIVHLRVHHPYVGTALDPGTSRVNESLACFLGRAFVLSWHSAWRVEHERLARSGLTPWRWENGLLRLLAVQMALFAAVAIVFGALGLALFLGQSVVALLLTLAIDYTQHYGVVRREVAPGRLERVRAHHAWSSDHASNRSTFNLGLHADHHLAPARGYTQLANAGGSLQTPVGYPGLVLLSMVPPLWYRVMNSRLAAGQGRG
jgi:alkane 1-monooxygenase